MAGIHLPDIGKLGIHVAAGVNDKKKVAPMNMAEEARLKAFLNRVENEKHERFRVIKKDLRRMKRRKRRIDQRLEDIGRSKTVPLTKERKHLKPTGSGTQLPPILKTVKTSPVAKKSRRKVKHGDEEEAINDKNTGLVSKTSVFPIQDELGNQRNSFPASNYNKSTLPPLSSPIKQELDTNGKQNTDKSRRKPSKERKIGSELSSKTTKRMSIALNSDNGASEVTSNDDDQSIADTNLLFLGFDTNLLRRKQPQQSLEDALIAIKACRYIRTPSMQENLEEDDVYSNNK